MIRKAAVNLLRWIGDQFGYKFVPQKQLFDWQKSEIRRWNIAEPDLSSEAAAELRMDHPRLLELHQRYQQCDQQVTTPLLWTEDRVSREEMVSFRGHNAFVYQVGGRTRNVIGYLLAAYYIKANDPMQLWDQLQEDGAFGAVTFNIGGKTISRDLLDSMMEIYFLEEALRFSERDSFSVLDIGAGYGRLAHRMTNTYPNLKHYLCTDAYPLATYLCDYYLKYRRVDQVASSVPLDEIQKSLTHHQIDLAVNIHSFSECTLSAIDWWLSLLEKQGVRYLFIVPNSRIHLLTVDRKSFHHLIENHGYQCIVQRQKYLDPLIHQYAANPGYYHLFEYQG